MLRTQDVLGEDNWNRLVERAGKPTDDDTTVYFEPEHTRYLVSYSLCDDGAINVYWARMASADAG